MPHRQFVFTIPKRLRIYFRFDRQLLGELCRAAWQVVRQVYAAASDHPEAAPRMIGAIQTFGDLVHFHPHIHALVSEGIFIPESTFVSLPKLATEPFLNSTHSRSWGTSDPLLRFLLEQEPWIENQKTGGGRITRRPEPGGGSQSQRSAEALAIFLASTPVDGDGEVCCEKVNSC